MQKQYCERNFSFSIRDRSVRYIFFSKHLSHIRCFQTFRWIEITLTGNFVLTHTGNFSLFVIECVDWISCTQSSGRRIKWIIFRVFLMNCGLFKIPKIFQSAGKNWSLISTCLWSICGISLWVCNVISLKKILQLRKICTLGLKLLILPTIFCPSILHKLTRR